MSEDFLTIAKEHECQTCGVTWTGECSEFCSECKIDDLERQLAEARELVTEADEYLDTNELTTICHGSILHQKFKQLMEQGE